MNKKIEVVYIVDISSSLAEYSKTINSALKQSISELSHNPYLSNVDIYVTVITFNHDFTYVYECTELCKTAEKDFNIKFNGTTNPGPAILSSVNNAVSRYKSWSSSMEKAFHPLIFYFSDGYPTAGRDATKEQEKVVVDAYESAVKTVRGLINDKKILFIGAGFGNADEVKIKSLVLDPSHYLKIDNGASNLERFFGEIIPATVTEVVTNGADQVGDMYKKSNS